MNILVHINHPAHVHLFRNAVNTWASRGHNLIIASRDKDIVLELLDAYHLKHAVVSKTSSGVVWELIEQDWRILKMVRQYKVDLLIGTSVAISHVSKVTRAKSIVFNEDDADYDHSTAWLSYPFADTIVIPNCVRDRRTPKYITHNSYHELAYLHPNNFQPDPSVLSELGVQPDEPFFIVRLVALRADHDIGQAGLSQSAQRRLIKLLSKEGRVFITSESNLPEDLGPYRIHISPHRIHHALSYARMLISDSQTMTVEAAVLGTPAIRCNTFVGRCSVIEELQQKYELTYGFLPQEENQMLKFIVELLDDKNLKEKWQQKREKMLAEKIDLNEWMVDLVENYFKKS
jgi:predicted glycosyltransferase